ncbi:adenylosuccinate synthase [Chloroflexota bacterium]
MSVLVVIGAQWGDEGKGKIVDMLAEKSGLICRFSGGDNAGHTVVNPQGEFKLHIIPSGIFSAGAKCVIGNGVVVNPQVLINEMDGLEARGVGTSHLYISDRTHLIMPYHILLDGIEEESRGIAAIGTTKKGIGPAYADKTARLGIRFGDLNDPGTFRLRLEAALQQKNALITKVYNQAPLSVDQIYDDYMKYAKRLLPHVTDTTLMINDAIANGEAVLLEGAQGALLDPDFGTYPYTTSSSPLASGSCLGTGIGPTKVNHVLGIFKAYCTRVGAGPIPTELLDATGDTIREEAQEYGTTTGRARRCGWFDGVVAKFTTRVNGFTSCAVTRLDVLDKMESLKICVAYEVDGAVTDNFPASAEVLARCKPIYEEMPGWQQTIKEIREFEKLPVNAQNYVNRLEQLTGAPVSIISVGERREQTIIKQPIP